MQIYPGTAQSCAYASSGPDRHCFIWHCKERKNHKRPKRGYSNKVGNYFESGRYGQFGEEANFRSWRWNCKNSCWMEKSWKYAYFLHQSRGVVWTVDDLNADWLYYSGFEIEPNLECQILIPVQHFWNHNPKPNSVMKFDGQSLIIRALRNLGSGEELFLDYKVPSNDHMLASFGFTMKHTKVSHFFFNECLKLFERNRSKSPWLTLFTYVKRYLDLRMRN